MLGVNIDRLLRYRLLNAPKIVSLTMTSRCNLRCVMCDHAVRNVEKEDFDPRLMDKIGDFISRADIVDLTGLGEPTLSDLFWKIMDRFRVSGAKPGAEPFLMFNTNAVLLSEQSITRIMRARVRRIRVSIDAPDPETFEQIRGTPLPNVVANANRLVQARNATGREFPKIGIEMTVMRRNLHQMNDMIDLAKEIGVDFVEFWSINDMPPAAAKKWIVKTKNTEFTYGDELLSSLHQIELEGKIAASVEYAERQEVGAAFVMLGKGTATSKYPKGIANDVKVKWKKDSIRCSLPWKELRATYKGDVFACCWGPKPIANLKDESMSGIWNGEAMRRMRRHLVDGKVPDLCRGAACQVLAGKRTIDNATAAAAEV
jgi:MoaA/NifB/PqqE/SkfB family radical SAM enzyme